MNEHKMPVYAESETLHLEFIELLPAAATPLPAGLAGHCLDKD